MGEIVNDKNGTGGLKRNRYRWILAVMVSLLGAYGSAGAFEVPTGNEDFELKWDNTFRYNLAGRVNPVNKAVIGNPNLDDGDRNFDMGLVSNRLDILSEADLVYKKNYGIRLSGAGWYDQRYHDHLDNTSPATSNHLVNGVPAVGFSNYTKRYFAGPSGELLDAFAFGKTEIYNMPLNIKVGRHTVFLGESLGLAGAIHGITYAQSPLDVAKGFATPGVEAKELFRPLNNISFQLQPTSTLSVAGQYFLEWDSFRLPEAGTYLGFSDVFMNGSESLIAGPGVRFTRGRNLDPSGIGDWGLSARWSPEWLEGTLGLYYRNFSDKLPQVHIAPAAKEFYMAYAQDIDLYGVSLAKQLLGVSIGAELSYRHNMPLSSDSVVISPANIPGKGQTGGARGDTWHALVNFLGLINKTPLFDSATWNMEYVWSRMEHVTQGSAVFKGRDSYTAIDKPTKDYVGGAVGFTPTWFQVFPGVDMTMPLSISSGLIGNSAVTFGGNKNAGSYAVGVGADIFSKYKVDLKYTDFFGDLATNPATGAVTVANGSYGLLSDRGFLSLTLKTTF